MLIWVDGFLGFGASEAEPPIAVDFARILTVILDARKLLTVKG